MKKIILFILVITIFSFLFNKAKANMLLIPQEAIRMRVIPNSNNEGDLLIKNKVKIELQKNISNLLKDTKGIEEARQTINSNLSNIDQNISNLLKKENYNIGYKINYALNYFPEKEYKGVLYKEGYYESVLVTLGEGKGDNWWCVLFPPLCLLEAEEADEVEYKFFIKEILDKFL